jgi:tRNA modification GTPase
VGEASATDSNLEQDRKLIDAMQARKSIFVANKSDLLGPTSKPAIGLNLNGTAYVRTSAITGEGIDSLREEILRQVGGDAATNLESGFLSNIRHMGLVTEAVASIETATAAVQNSIPHEMLLLDLYSALRALDAMTGETSADDILHLIFSSFCIGK